MDLEQYAISKMCHSDEAIRHAITKLKPEDFTDGNRRLFSIAKSIYQVNKSVDLHVLASQYVGQGGNGEYVTKVFNYALDHSDEWENVFSELKSVASKRRIREDIREIQEKAEVKSVQEIASLTTRKSVSWITDSEKSYYSGREIDEMKEEFGEPVKTGVPVYDEHIYKYGGNRRGQMKGVICREKHGKTRSECWEVAQNIRMGHKVLYITMEGTKKDITGNVKQVLQHDWKAYRENLFVVDGRVHIDELEAVILEAVMCEGVQKVVIDYIQLVLSDGESENVRINNATERLRHMMVKHDFHLAVLSQARKESVYTTTPKDANGNEMMPKGWKHVPNVNDAYGSNALIKASSIIIVGFRPNLYQENIKTGAISSRVMNPVGKDDPFHSFYMQIERNRYKPEYLHKWWRFQDSDEGLKNPLWL